MRHQPHNPGTAREALPTGCMERSHSSLAPALQTDKRGAFVPIGRSRAAKLSIRHRKVIPHDPGAAYFVPCHPGLGGSRLELGSWNGRAAHPIGPRPQKPRERRPTGKTRSKSPLWDQRRTRRSDRRKTGPTPVVCSGATGSIHRRNPDCVQRPRRAAPPSMFSTNR